MRGELHPPGHGGGAGYDERKAGQAARRELLVEHQEGEQDGNQDGQLVNLHHNAYLTCGDGVVGAQP